MPRASVPKLKLGRRVPTKASGGGGGSSTGANMVAAAIFSLVFILVVLAILNMVGVITIFKSKKRTKAGEPERPLANGLDRRTDDEAPVPKPVPVAEQPKMRIETQKPKQPPARRTTAIGNDFFDQQFAPLDRSQFEKQFDSQSTTLAKKALSSQLKSDALMPRFSSDRQPTRQTGMPLDMVYTEIRAEHAPKAAKMGTEQVPFGGSEFHEMRRAQTLGQWRDTFE